MSWLLWLCSFPVQPPNAQRPQASVLDPLLSLLSSWVITSNPIPSSTVYILMIPKFMSRAWTFPAAQTPKPSSLVLISIRISPRQLHWCPKWNSWVTPTPVTPTHRPTPTLCLCERPRHVYPGANAMLTVDLGGSTSNMSSVHTLLSIPTTPSHAFLLKPVWLPLGVSCSGYKSNNSSGLKPANSFPLTVKEIHMAQTWMWLVRLWNWI